MLNALFFGAWSPRELGHRTYKPNGWRLSHEENPTPWERLDGALVSGNSGGEQFVVERHAKDGWIALAFWDRTGDSRPGSNSVILAKACNDDEALKAFAVAFPEQWNRWKKAGAAFAQSKTEDP